MNTGHEDITNDASSKIPEKEFASWEEFKSFVSKDLLSKSVPFRSRSALSISRARRCRMAISIKVRKNIRVPSEF